MKRQPMTLRQTMARALVLPVTFLLAALAVWGTLSVAGVTFGQQQTWGQAEPVAVPQWQTDAEALSVQYDCSTTGLPDGVIPAHAIILLDEQARLVSFDRGWASMEGTKPGTLLQVCAL